MNLISTITAHWISEDIKLNAPATAAQIAEVERQAGYLFPLDFKLLYQTVDGFCDGNCLPNMFSLWPLQRILEEYQQQLIRSKSSSTYQQEWSLRFIGFADYLFNAHQLGFFKGKAGIFKSYDEFNPIADTFLDALLLINKDAEAVY